MLINNIKIALRNILKSKFHSFINITGFAFSLAVCILIFTYLNNEMSFDSQHKNIKNIYSINSVFNIRGNTISQAVTQPVLADELKKTIPEIKYATKINEETGFIKGENREVEKMKIYFTDSDFFNMFTFNFVSIGSDIGLDNKQNVIITKKTADKYFGEERAVGKMIDIKISDKFEKFIVVGVLNDIPENSTLKFDLVIPFKKLRDFNNDNYFTSWGMYSTHCFIQLHSQEMSNVINDKLLSFVKTRFTSEKMKYSAVPFSDIHWGSDVNASIGQTNNIHYIQSAFLIAVLIILIASVNYSNLSIAKIPSRLKEIAIKKVMGASRIKLITQYLFESIIVLYLSFGLGLIFAELSLPIFNHLINENLSLAKITEMELFIPFLLLPLLLGLISGFIPALFSTKYSPNETFQNKITYGKTSVFNKILMSFQFSVSLILLIVTLFMGKQIDYINNFETGINSDQVMVVELDKANSRQVLNQLKLNKIPGILNIAGSNFCPGYGMNGSVINQFENRIQVNVGRIDENFIPLLDINLLEGRNFSIEHNDDHKSVIINKSLAKLLQGNYNSIKMNWAGLNDIRVVGVIEDFNFESLHSEIGPMLFYINNDYSLYYMYIKLSKNNFNETIASINNEWINMNSEYPFNYYFLDESFNQLYTKEKSWHSLLSLSSFFAILIALSGLVGFTSLIASKRIKEIVIRKVIGASTKDILTLLSKDYISIIIFSSVISIPISYYLTSIWLNDFSYKISLSILVFLFSIFIVASLIQMIVLIIAYKAYLINPVNALRNE